MLPILQVKQSHVFVRLGITRLEFYGLLESLHSLPGFTLFYTKNRQIVVKLGKFWKALNTFHEKLYAIINSMSPRKIFPHIQIHPLFIGVIFFFQGPESLAVLPVMHITSGLIYRPRKNG